MSENTSPLAAILIIGNEILSGRTKDLNSSFLAQKLLSIGIFVGEIRVVSDKKSEIIAALNTLRERYDYVFSSGGIGPTHDDITSECVAEAFGVPLHINNEAKQLLKSYYAKENIEFNQARLQMARIPIGAFLIENPISKAPGFQISNVFVLAGVPKIFQAMVEEILQKLAPKKAIISRTVTKNKPEGEIAEKLAKIASRFPEVSIGSYPFETKGIIGTNLVVTHQDEKTILKVVFQLSKI